MTCFIANLEEIIYKAERTPFQIPLPRSLGDWQCPACKEPRAVFKQASDERDLDSRSEAPAQIMSHNGGSN